MSQNNLDYLRGRADGAAEVVCGIYTRLAAFCFPMVVIGIIAAIAMRRWQPLIPAGAALVITVLCFILWRKIRNTPR